MSLTIKWVMTDKKSLRSVFCCPMRTRSAIKKGWRWLNNLVFQSEPSYLDHSKEDEEYQLQLQDKDNAQSRKREGLRIVKSQERFFHCGWTLLTMIAEPKKKRIENISKIWSCAPNSLTLKKFYLVEWNKTKSISSLNCWYSSVFLHYATHLKNAHNTKATKTSNYVQNYHFNKTMIIYLFVLFLCIKRYTNDDI